MESGEVMSEGDRRDLWIHFKEALQDLGRSATEARPGKKVWEMRLNRYWSWLDMEHHL